MKGEGRVDLRIRRGRGVLISLNCLSAFLTYKYLCGVSAVAKLKRVKIEKWVKLNYEGSERREETEDEDFRLEIRCVDFMVYEKVACVLCLELEELEEDVVRILEGGKSIKGVRCKDVVVSHPGEVAVALEKITRRRLRAIGV
jgi:hypothetical protein